MSVSDRTHLGYHNTMQTERIHIQWQHPCHK